MYELSAKNDRLKKNKQKLDSASVRVKDMLAGLTTEDITSKKAGIRAMTVKENKNKKLLAHAAEFRYYSSDTSVANNGAYKTIKVTVGE